MLWSVLVEADGDRAVTREEVVELADAVAAASGIASGIGTNGYGARLLVEADTPDEATALGREEFTRAAAAAGLPPWPIVTLTATSEDDDEDDDDQPATSPGQAG
ncbi:hypothetical protein ACPPVT_04930 [Angustibacter sp. McL0619]|uniref:hypothetical protein n=1 Tax=Angustibacter sp. McL0619 TaxID=3415676 RepID=UPI003CE9672D